VAIPRNLFADILRLIAELRPPPKDSALQAFNKALARLGTYRRRAEGGLRSKLVRSAKTAHVRNGFHLVDVG